MATAEYQYRHPPDGLTAVTKVPLTHDPQPCTRLLFYTVALTAIQARATSSA